MFFILERVVHEEMSTIAIPLPKKKKNDCLHFSCCSQLTERNTWERIHAGSHALNATRLGVTAPSTSAPANQTHFSAVTAGITRATTATRTLSRDRCHRNSSQTSARTADQLHHRNGFRSLSLLHTNIQSQSRLYTLPRMRQQEGTPRAFPLPLLSPLSPLSQLSPLPQLLRRRHPAALM